MKAGFRDAVTRARSSHRLVEAVAEALRPFDFSSSAEVVVKEAMGQSCPSFELDDQAALRGFLHGPLYRALEDRLGPAVAPMVLGTVEQALGLLPPAEDSGVISRAPPSSSPEPVTQPTPPRHTLLLVASDRALVERLLPILEDGSFAVVLCDDPEQAAYLCRTARPAALLLDDEPDPQGRHRRLQRLRAALLDEQPTLILLTSRAPSTSKAVAAVAPRTVERETLLATLQSVMGHTTAPSIPAPPATALPATGGNSALLAEVLGTVATPERAATIVARALEVARLAQVPEDMLTFVSFAVGALHQVVADVVSEDMATSLVAELSAIVQRARATSGVVRRTRPASSRPPQAPPPRTADGQRIEVLLVGARSGSFAVALEQMGFLVAKAPHGHAALDLCARRRPHALVVGSDSRGLSVQQLSALLELSLDGSPPAVVALAPTAHLSIEGAAQVLDEQASSRELARALQSLLSGTDADGRS
jgi:DNA-binding response OmpR family regulator